MFWRTCIVILLWTLRLGSGSGDEFKWIHGDGTSGGGGTHGQDEYHFQSDNSYPERIVNPDEKMSRRLVVEWGRASVGYVDYEDRPSNGPHEVKTWKGNQPFHSNRKLAIRGRLLIESADGQERQPIDWLQGVRVVVSRRPDQKQDWSKRHEMHETESGDTVIWNDGEFMALLSPGEVQRPVAKEAKFQVALALAEREGDKITWRNTVGVLPQSVTMLKIPGPPAISETMQIINGAPSYNQNDFNPAKLVRAVNHLMPLGKDQALRELRRFLRMARDSYETRRIDENIDTSDKTCVFLIVRLLFEPEDPAAELPSILTVPFVPDPTENDRKLWPLHPVYLQNDLPFFLVYGGNLGGMPDQPERHIKWAKDHGKIRNKPLRPLDSPMLAARRLVELPQTARLYQQGTFAPDFANLLYQQAWNIIEEADPKSAKPKPLPPVNTFEKPDWQGRLKAASAYKIRWSAADGRYLME